MNKVKKDKEKRSQKQKEEQEKALDVRVRKKSRICLQQEQSFQFRFEIAKKNPKANQLFARTKKLAYRGRLLASSQFLPGSVYLTGLSNRDYFASCPYPTILVSLGTIGDIKGALVDRRKTGVCIYQISRMVNNLVQYPCFLILYVTKGFVNLLFWYEVTRMLHINHYLCSQRMQVPWYSFCSCEQSIG